MSNTTQYNEAVDTEGLYDADGREIGQATRRVGDMYARVEDCVRAQPVKSAVIALGVGYLLGRFKLLSRLRLV